MTCIVKTGCDGDLNKCPASFRSGVLPQPTDIAYLVIAGDGIRLIVFPFTRVTYDLANVNYFF